MASDQVEGRAPFVAGFSVGETASRVGVTASTLRSWDRRYGLGPSGRSSGGHRRYTLGDLARLQRVRRFVTAGMSTADAATASLAFKRSSASQGSSQLRRLRPFGDDQLISRLVEAADVLDSPGVARATRALLNERGVIHTWTDVLIPLLQQIGRYWQRHEHGVECEHVISDALQAVLLTYAWDRQQQNRQESPIAVLAATPNEGHTLPLYAAAAALAEREIHARVVGSLPPPSLLMALEQLGPTAVVLWARTQNTADAVVLRSLRDQVPLLCAAGDWPRDAIAGCIVTGDLVRTVRAVADWMHPAAGQPAQR